MTSTLVESTEEFDRFGPWIDQVTTPDEVPRLYRDFPLDLASTRLVLKVPRNISRREANPSMDLYDQLIILDELGITVLSRRGAIRSGKAKKAKVESGYDTVTALYSEVFAIHDSVHLLDGRLTVHTHEGPEIVVRYNGSARSSVASLMGALRAAAIAASPSAAGARVLWAGRAVAARRGELDPGRADIILVNDFDGLAAVNAGLTAWSCHGRGPAVPARNGKVGALQRLKHRFLPTTLHGALVAGDDDALEIVGRREWLWRTRAPTHSRSRLVVPLGAIEAIETLAHPRFAGVTLVRFVAGASAVEIALPEGSDAAALFVEAAADAQPVV